MLCLNLAGNDEKFIAAQTAAFTRGVFEHNDKQFYVFNIEHVQSHATDYYKVHIVELSPLRRLRMWHWRIVLRARANEQRHRAAAEKWERQHGRRCGSSRHQERANYNLANFHLKAVQALNDVLTDTTAETDCNNAN